LGPSNDPDGDDYGLPPVDIAIPDDARELERDIIAYRRELRQERLRRRWQRLFGPLTRYGVATPIIAGALLVALVSATLMTVFAARTPTPEPPTQDGPPVVRQPPGLSRGDQGGQGAGAGQPGQHGQPGQSGTGVAGTELPEGRLSVTGRGGGTRRLRDLRSTVIALIPAACQCDDTLRGLVEQGRRYEVEIYLVTADPPGDDLRALAEDGAGDDPVRAAQDSRGVLSSAYRPSGLTALLVHSNGVVGDVRRDMDAGDLPGRWLERLRQPA
jgi:hypothetical protein